jgi:type IV pilus assembly protein PilY1
MLNNVTTQVRNLKSSAASVETYVIGFALPYGVDPAQLNAIALAGGTNTAYNASDTATLNATFATIFADILSKTASASSVALNSQSISTGSRVYQARFNSGDWSGQLLSIVINPDGSLGSPVWDAGQVINSQVPTNRTVLTYKPSNLTGIPFRWPANESIPTATELDTSQLIALNTSSSGTDSNGSARLDYLRGSSANEGTGLNFRPRVTSKLGDIVNSAPNFVGAPQFNYNETDYASFRATYLNRTPMVYCGANDGMLHGFDTSSGQERIAYVPSSLYPNLSKLTFLPYAHRYFVDGSPNSADVFYGGAWRTALVSGMGGGARGLFSLNVTDPSTFSEDTAGSLVNFEFTATNDVDVGYISRQAPIAKLNNGVWAAIFGNGYNITGTGYATLFIVDIKTGVVIKKISTGIGSAGTPNALANPIAIDTDGNRTADTAYAGDLLGNMWKFDISSSNPTSWGVAYSGNPLYQAKDSSANAQPITTTPEVGKHPNGGYLVFFGTGKYLESADVSSTGRNSVYAIWDNGAQVTGALLQQTVTGVTTINSQDYRTTSQNAINWTTYKGWYVNLPTSGERAVTDPTLHNGRLSLPR